MLTEIVILRMFFCLQVQSLGIAEKMFKFSLSWGSSFDIFFLGQDPAFMRSTPTTSEAPSPPPIQTSSLYTAKCLTLLPYWLLNFISPFIWISWKCLAFQGSCFTTFCSFWHARYGAETFSTLFLISDLPIFFYGTSYTDLSSSCFI